MARVSNNGSLKKWALSSNVIRLASLALVVIAIITLGAVAYFTERGIVASRDWVIHTYQVQTQLRDLQLELMQAKADKALSISVEHKGKLPQQIQKQGQLARETLHGLYSLTRDNSHQQARLNQLSPMMERFLSVIERDRGTTPTVDGSSLTPLESGRAQDQVENKMNAIIESMRDDEQILLTRRLTAWNYLFHRNVIMLVLAFSAVALMLAYNFWLLIAEVIRSKARENHVQANADSYRLMSARILELQDSERRRIARELHDSVGQYLAGLKINLSQLENGKRANSHALLEETIELTDWAIQEVRTISHLLHPPLLEDLGFLSAARWYVDEYGKRSKVDVSLFIDEPIGRLPKEVEIALFRVLQETLTNVYRHAAARKVDIRIANRSGQVYLTVADDGKGIPQQVLSKFNGGAAPGIGLAGMRERLAEFGGNMSVHSSGGGSVVEVTIPTMTRTSTPPPEHQGAA